MNADCGHRRRIVTHNFVSHAIRILRGSLKRHAILEAGDDSKSEEPSCLVREFVRRKT